MEKYFSSQSEIIKLLDSSKSVSVSRGCFGYKGKKKGVKTLSSYFGSGEGEEERMMMYERLWADILSRVQVLQSEMTAGVFEAVLEFAGSAYGGDKGSERFSIVKEIPTAALLTGVNAPDHDVLFTNLTSLCRSRVSRHVAVIKSKDCPTIKHLTQRVIEQITGSDPDGYNLKKSSATISTLAKWYEEKSVITAMSPSKKRRPSRSRVPGPAGPVVGPVVGPVAPLSQNVIVILEDLERFNPVVVQDFIVTCSYHVDRLPVVLVFGVATAVTAIHRILPHAVSSLLAVEKFQAAPSNAFFSQIVTETVMTSQFPFKLGARVFDHLVDIFLMNDFSVMNYVSSLQFLLMEHFYTNRVSLLCCYNSDIETTVDGLKEAALGDVRQCASFMRFVEVAPPEEQHALLLDGRALKEKIKKMLLELRLYHKNFFPVLKCLHILASSVPKAPLGRQIRVLYGRCLESDIFEQEDYKTTFSVLRTMSRDTCVALLQQCTDYLADAARTGCDRLMEISRSLTEYLDKLKAIDDTAALPDSRSDRTSAETIRALPKKTDMLTLKKCLRNMKDQTRKLSIYELARNESLDYMDGVFRMFLYCYKRLPLYECMYSESPLKVRHHINASPLTSLHVALTNPQHYLKNENARSDHGEVSELLPDLSIVFKLHLECGRLINLYDWLQAFITVVNSGTKSARHSDKTLQARFIRAVCELQFLGFIKSTKRKTDHVMRLTWGGC